MDLLTYLLTNHYAATRPLPTTTRRLIYYQQLLSTTTLNYAEGSRTVIMFQPRGVQFLPLFTYYDVPPLNQLTYRERLLLQLCDIINWHSVPVRSVVPIPVMMLSLFRWWCRTVMMIRVDVVWCSVMMLIWSVMMSSRNEDSWRP